MVERNIERISHLVRDLLAYSRVGVGELVPTDPNGLAEEVFALFSETAARVGIKLTLESDSSLGPAALDPKALHTCLANLLSNAIDACAEDTQKKEHRVVLRTLKGLHGEVCFEVEDNGVGMDRSTKEKLFQRFFSSKGTRGTGLGLMLTNKLVHEHGGVVSVESELGKGIQVPDFNTCKLTCQVCNLTRFDLQQSPVLFRPFASIGQSFRNATMV